MHASCDLTVANILPDYLRTYTALPVERGEDEGARTPDSDIKSVILYQLSYIPMLSRITRRVARCYIIRSVAIMCLSAGAAGGI